MDNRKDAAIFSVYHIYEEERLVFKVFQLN
jgi:hypothetical protein